QQIRQLSPLQKSLAQKGIADASSVVQPGLDGDKYCDGSLGIGIFGEGGILGDQNLF
ncbi:Hypothetical protein FKW44_001484, partial [Caligus rogercresseyi]